MYCPNRLAASVLLCLLLCGSPLHAQTPPTPDLQAAASRSRAAGLEAQSNYAAAIAEYQRAYARDKTTHREDASLDLNLIGHCYLSLRLYPKALEFFQQELALEHQLGDTKDEATTLNNIGWIDNTLSHYAQAIAFYQQALPLWRLVGDKADEAVTLNGIGWAYDSLGQYPKAIDFYQQSLALRRQVGNKAGEANELNNIGLAYYNLSRYAQAIDFYQRALTIQQQIGEKTSEAVTFSNIGEAYHSQSQYAQALDFYQQALTLQQHIGDNAGAGTTLSNIGAVYKELGQDAKALELYQQALTLHTQAQDRPQEAITLSNIGSVYDDLSQYPKALDFYQQALPLFRQLGDKAGEATTLDNIGGVYVDLGRYPTALDFYQRALTLRRQVGDRKGEAVTLSNIGLVNDDLGRPARALGFYQEALPIQQQVGDHGGEATTLNNFMFAWKALNQPGLAIWYGKQAVNVLQSIRQDIQSLAPEAQKSYLAANANTYRALADLLISQGRLPEAQQILRLLKEQEFFDYLHGSTNTTPVSQDSAALTRREARNAKRYEAAAAPLAALGQERQKLPVKNPLAQADRQRLAALNAQAESASEHLTQVLAQIAKDFSGPPNADDAPPLTAGAQDVGKALRPGMVAVYTIVAPDKLDLIVVTPAQGGTASQPLVRTFPIKSDDLYKKVYAFRQALTHPTLDPRPLGAELFQMIFGPIQKDLESAHTTTLLFSLDDALRYVPPATLYDNKAKKYVAEEYRTETITLINSETSPATPRAALSVLGMGVSKAQDNDPPLPGVKQELAAIGGLFPGKRLLDAQFTQTAMLGALAPDKYPLVHIASHFALYPTDAASYLLLGDGTQMTVATMKQNPHLFAGVNLLTLSACDTAMEIKNSSGKEVEGFGALAQQLGARSVVASLWPVSDAATPVWMQAFYDAQKQHPTVSLAEALRQAQLAMLGRAAPLPEQGRTQRAGRAVVDDEDMTSLPAFKIDPAHPYAHPYYWAPFILIGNWQ